MSERAAALRVELIRNFNRVDKVIERRDPLYDTATARLAEGTAASKLGVSIDVVEPGKAACPYHFHYAQEEAFVILEGCGTLRVSDEHLPIEAGDTIFIPPGPAYPHQIINTSNAPLKYLSISTRESPEIVVYPDSAKYLARAAFVSDGQPARFDSIHRLDASLDYFDGEP